MRERSVLGCLSIFWVWFSSFQVVAFRIVSRQSVSSAHSPTSLTLFVLLHSTAIAQSIMAFKDLFPSQMPRYANLRSSTEKAGSDSSEPDEDEPFVRHHRGDGHPRRHWQAIAILAVLLCANIAVMAVSVSYRAIRPHPPRSTVSDNDFETRPLSIRRIFLPDGDLNLEPPTDYTGPPRPALESAWAKLQQRAFSSVQSLKRFG